MSRYYYDGTQYQQPAIEYVEVRHPFRTVFYGLCCFVIGFIAGGVCLMVWVSSQVVGR